MNSSKIIVDLSKCEKRIFSQNGEDGVLAEILNKIGVESRTFFEIGAGTGHECNSRILWQAGNFRGVMFDAKCPPRSEINLYQEFFTKENCLSILKKYGVPISVDVFSIDIDLNDFYITKEILKFYRPRVIITEYNSIFDPTEDKIVVYSPNDFWSGDNYIHASLLSWYKLFSLYNYSLVYCEQKGINCFWINNISIPEGIEFVNANNLEALYKKRDWDTPDKRNRPFITFEEAMKI